MRIIKDSIQVDKTLGIVSFRVEDISEMEKPLEWQSKGKDLEAKIQTVRHKRSLNANAYSWVLTGKIADRLNIDKEECHRLMLAKYGQTAMDSNDTPIVLSVRADVPEEEVEKTLHGYVAPLTQHSWIGDKEFVHYRVLKSSSEFNSYEMNVFIDGIVAECKELGIETLPPQEIEKMKQIYGVE